MDPRKPPMVLIFEISPIAPSVHLNSENVLALRAKRMAMICDFKFSRKSTVLAAHPQIHKTRLIQESQTYRKIVLQVVKFITFTYIPQEPRLSTRRKQSPRLQSVRISCGLVEFSVMSLTRLSHRNNEMETGIRSLPCHCWGI